MASWAHWGGSLLQAWLQNFVVDGLRNDFSFGQRRDVDFDAVFPVRLVACGRDL